LISNTEKIYWFRFIPRKFPSILLFFDAVFFLCVGLFLLWGLSRSGPLGIFVLAAAFFNFILFLICFIWSRVIRRYGMGDVMKKGISIWRKVFILLSVCFSIFALFVLYYVVELLIIYD
jgi:hypothetical protein